MTSILRFLMITIQCNFIRKMMTGNTMKKTPRFQPIKMLRYAVDTINNQIITGWCYSRIQPRKPITLSLYAGNKLIGKVISNEFRQDLLEHSFHPTGKCGFTFSFPKNFQLEKDCSLKICTRSLFSSVLVRYRYDEVPQVSEDKLPPLVFMHIPKTAGTSFNAYARQFFPAGKSITHIEEIPEDQADFIRTHKYIAGHLPLGTLTRLCPPEHCTYYTLLRDPVKHLHSHLNWVKGVGADPTSVFYKRHSRVIQDLATRLNRELNRKTGNIQDTLHAFVQHLNGFERDFFDNIQTRYFLDYRPERVTSEDIRAAKKNCSVFRRIGTTETYKQFTEQFCCENGLNYVEQKRPLNRSKQKSLYDPASPDIKEILFPLVKYDMELYDYICSSR